MSEQAIQFGDLQEAWNSVTRYYYSAMALVLLSQGQTNEWTEDIAGSFRLFGEYLFYYTRIPIGAMELWDRCAQQNGKSYLYQAIGFAESVRTTIWPDAVCGLSQSGLSQRNLDRLAEQWVTLRNRLRMLKTPEVGSDIEEGLEAELGRACALLALPAETQSQIFQDGDRYVTAKEAMKLTAITFNFLNRLCKDDTLRSRRPTKNRREIHLGDLVKYMLERPK